MIILFIAILFLAFLLCPNGIELLGVSNAAPWHCFTYPFMHISWLHLCINALALILMYNPIRDIYCARYDKSHTHFFLAVYSCAVLAGVCCASDVPTVGASGLVFTLLGILLPLNPTLRQLRNYIWVVLAVIIQAFLGKSNVPLHICAFLFGALIIVFLNAREQIRIKE